MRTGQVAVRTAAKSLERGYIVVLGYNDLDVSAETMEAEVMPYRRATPLYCLGRNAVRARSS